MFSELHRSALPLIRTELAAARFVHLNIPIKRAKFKHDNNVGSETIYQPCVKLFPVILTVINARILLAPSICNALISSSAAWPGLFAFSAFPVTRISLSLRLLDVTARTPVVCTAIMCKHNGKIHFHTTIYQVVLLGICVCVAKTSVDISLELTPPAPRPNSLPCLSAALLSIHLFAPHTHTRVYLLN